MNGRSLSLVACLFLAACASSKPAASKTEDLSLPEAFTLALSDGRFDDARAEAGRLQASSRIGVALRARLRLGKRLHDAALVRAIAADPHVDLLEADPLAWNELARALLWTASVAEAAPFLESVCADARLAADSKDRRSACSYAALGKLARERPQSLEGESRAVVDLMTKIPLPIVLASVNGQKPEPFIVDTGAATSVLSKAYCDRVGIPYLTEHSHVGGSPGGEVTLFPALVDEIKIGGIVVRNWSAQVIELPPQLKIGGILAPQDTLRGMVTELDGRELKLRLYRDLDEKGWETLVGAAIHSQPLIWGDGNLYLRARVGEAVQGWLLFDTGAGACLLTPDAAKALGHAPDESAAHGSVTAGAQAKVFQKFEELVTVGDAKPRREEIAVVSEPEPDEVQRVGSIGFPWTLGRRVALSRDGVRVLFTDSAYP